MGSAASRLNGYAFPVEPEDGTVAADEPPAWVDWIGLALCAVVVVGFLAVIIRIAIGVGS